jgi:hypothetical protein
MKNNRIYIISLLIGTLFCTAYYFIKISNDHLECETVTSFKKDKNGNKVVDTKHICKEKYSF